MQIYIYCATAESHFIIPPSPRSQYKTECDLIWLEITLHVSSARLVSELNCLFVDFGIIKIDDHVEDLMCKGK